MSAVAEPGYPSRSVAWYMVVVLMICYTLSYADRQILAFLVRPLEHDLNITDTQVGQLQGFAFSLFYTFFGLPMGALADRVSRRNLVAIGLVLWSLMTSLSSVARSFYLLAAARMGVGIGEATLSPCAFSMIADSFPKERLGGALSTYTMGIQMGSGLALIIGGVVAQTVSHMPPLDIPFVGSIAAWRLTFLIVGAPGLLVALVLLSVREPARRALLLNADGAPAKLGLRALLQQVGMRWRSALGLSVMISCQATCNYALLGWGPAFFDRLHHWPQGRTGLVLGLTTLVCGCGGLFVGGRVSDHWYSRGITDAPLRVGLISLCGMLLTLVPAMLLPTAAGTVALLIPAVFCIGLPIGCGYAAVQLIFPNQARGLVSAIVIFAVAMIGLNFGAVLPGYLDDHWFHDPNKIGWSISLTVALAASIGLLAAVLSLAPYRAAYRATLAT
jgi:MFS family permease